jgi:hypothetical protein
MLAAGQGNEFGEALRLELAQEPVASLSQHGFAAEVKELKIQLGTLEWRRHRSTSADDRT